MNPKLRICQICRTEHPLENYYTKDVYICRGCNTIIAYLSRFKKLVKNNDVNVIKDDITRDKLLLRAKENILHGHVINEVARCFMQDWKGVTDEV